jgi:hypothetical protein
MPAALAQITDGLLQGQKGASLSGIERTLQSNDWGSRAVRVALFNVLLVLLVERLVARLHVDAANCLGQTAVPLCG